MNCLAQAKPTVIFFGGWGASSADMATWETGVRQSSYGSRFDFQGVPYPRGAGWHQGNVLTHGQQEIINFANLIKGNPQREFILVAHSSASQLPGEIAKYLPKTSHVKVVILDGFNAAAAVQDKFPTICYSATMAMNSCRKKVSFAAMGCSPKAHMCAHFRMVNWTATSGLTNTRLGYQNFTPYLSWLDQVSPPTSDNSKAGGQDERGGAR